MSTKIYDAYVWTGAIEELMEFLRNYRKEYQSGLIDYLVESFYVKNMVKEVGLGLKLVQRLTDDLSSATRSHERHPLSFEASVSVIFYDSRIFVKKLGFDGIRPDFHHDKLVDYHYQNQVDKPYNISEKDWDERGDVWNYIFKEFDTFTEAGLTYDFLDEYDIFKICFKVDIRLSMEKK